MTFFEHLKELKVTKIGEVEVLFLVTEEHVNGTITHPKLAYLTADETLQLVNEETPGTVIAVAKKLGKKTAILTFACQPGDDIPDDVLLGWDRVEVYLYEPKPPRFFKCQLYGHIAKNCSAETVYPRHAGQLYPTVQHVVGLTLSTMNRVLSFRMKHKS